MEKELLQITLRIKDPKMKQFLKKKLKYLKNKGIKGVSYQSMFEGLIAKWMTEEDG